MRSKKRMRQALVFLVMILLLAGCHGKEKTMSGQTKENVFSGETCEFQFLDDVELAWKDNSLDDWQAVINLPIKDELAEGDQAKGRGDFMLNEAGCTFFRNHVTSYYKKDWSGVSVITAEGEGYSKRIEANSDWEGLQVSLLGSTAGGTGYVACKDFYEGQANAERWLIELDEKFEPVRTTRLSMDSYENLEAIKGDSKGNFHLTYPKDGQKKYEVFSSDGTLVFEATGDFEERLSAFGAGRVAICELEKDGSKPIGRTFYEADLEKGELREVGVLREAAIKKETNEKGAIFATLVNESQILFFGEGGAYLCNERGEDAKIIYRWVNHGMAKINVRDAIMTGGDAIGIVYEEGKSFYYLALRPTLEKIPIKTITLAVSSSNVTDYVSAAAYFNKKYPAYQVQVKDDYDETSLMTQLGAGDGPVLIDTSLTGFEELERLWQPLDGFLEASGIGEALVPQAREFGKIGDKTYGVVTNFWIRTTLTADEELKDWDYEGFLKYLEKHGDAAAFTSKYIESTTDWRNVFFHFLNNGIEDNYYLNAETGSSIFGTKEFERVTKLSEKAQKCLASGEGKALRSGAAVCELCDLYGIQNIIELRMRLEQSGDKVLGYPTKDGARNLLMANSPIVIRITATEEEKKMAYTFLQIVLSQEAMTSSIEGKTYGLFSVRKDVLGAQFKEYKEVTDSMGTGELPKLDEEKDQKLLEDLLKKAVPQRSFPVALENIMDEEFGAYLKGGIDGKTLSEHLKSRVWLYLEESK